jgi:ABC-2 type transport system ATP-binding protein
LRGIEIQSRFLFENASHATELRPSSRADELHRPDGACTLPIPGARRHARMSLELRSVSRRFGAQLALDRLSLHVRDGDCYGFIGHNGAGKTTAMRIALGLQRPDEGTVVIDGFDAARHPREARARMGALIETPGFQPGWSGAKNLTELLRLQGFSRVAARAEAGRWIERVGLAAAGEKHVQAYSQGMRQRLGLAQALLGSPRYLLLDEPTNGVDPEGIAEMRDLLRSLHQAGTTLLVSSHQIHELSGICNRIGVLRQGRLLLEIETARLLGAQASRWRLTVRDAEAARASLVKLGIPPPLGGPDGALLLDLGGEAPERVTRVLVERGVDVVSFFEEKPTLESIYLRSSAGTQTAVPAPRTDPPPTAAPADPRAPGHAISRMTRFDLRRLVSSPGPIALFTAPAVVGAIAMFRRAGQAASEQSAVQSAKLFSTTDVTAFQAVGLALQAGLPLLAFLSLALASQSIAAELGRGTLRNVLLRPLVRAEAALGKSFALVVFVLGSYVFLSGTALLLGAIVFEFRDVTETLPNGALFTLTPAGEIWPDLRRALLSPILPLTAYTGLGFLAGSIARTGAAALGFALSLGVLLDLGRAFTRAFRLTGGLPSDYLPSPLSDTSFVGFYVDVSRGVSNARFEHPAGAMLVPVAWALATFLLATLFLVRKPIP